jgi:alkylation response protein AidB-like acyl-CoA dehydrogenase
MTDLNAYRARVGEWLAANTEPRAEARRGDPLGLGREFTPDVLAAERALQRKLHEAGYAGITVPEEYGGQGLTPAHQQVFGEEARPYVLPDFGLMGHVCFDVCIPTMLAHASPEFLARRIPAILSGDDLYAEYFSEPDAGSDLAGVRTRAVRRDDGTWLLSGSKTWTSGGHYADYGMCLARTDWDQPKHRGLTWFAVPTRARGVTVRRIRQITGDADFCEEFFDDVELTDDDMIGPLNGGWAVTQTMLFYERGGGAGTSGKPKKRRTAIAPDLAALAAEAGRSGDPLACDLITRAHVDDLVRDAFGTRLGALMRASPAAAASLASYGKLAAGTFEPARAALAMRIGGDAALTWTGDGGPGASAAAGLLNGRFMAIAGGTNEMQRNTISERVLGLPREPAFDTRKPFGDVLRGARTWDGRVG